jgi:hypothetical protein
MVNKRTARSLFGIAVLLVLLIVFAIPLLRWQIENMSSPWYGRARQLAALPYLVVEGPVDAVRGIPGTLEMGMSRSELLHDLGEPLVKRMSIQEAERKGFGIDPEDVAQDFFAGVFAWVSYNARDEVASLTFDLQAFHERFHGRQTVTLSYKDRTYRLSDELTRGEAARIFSGKSGAPRGRVSGAEIILLGTGTSLSFDNEDRLSRVDVTDYISAR